MQNLITDHLETWTTAKVQKASGGRGRKSATGESQYGIQKLRELILDLAVRGKLVPQDPNDEPASVLLEKIAEEKARLVKAGTIKKQKRLPEIDEDEKPFNLPSGWVWTKLDNLSSNVHYGYTASANPGITDVRLLRITDIQNSRVNWESVPGCEICEDSVSDYQLADGDILIARTGGTIGKSYLVKDINVCSVFASYLIRVQNIKGSYPPFIKTFLGSQMYWQQLYESSMGTGQPNVNGNALKNLRIPVPPLDEQHRIVAKVDELMALCDTLEQEQIDNSETHLLLVKTLLETLTNATDHDDFIESWQRIEKNFDILFTTPESIDELKQTILQLAVMGKLVPQDPNDEPASVLLWKIAEEKKKQISQKRAKDSGKVHRKAPLQPPFQIRENWEWVRFRDVIWCYRGHNPPKTEFIYNPKKGYVRFIQITDFKTDKNAVYVPKSKKNKMVYKGEIIMAAYRHIGKLSREMEGAFNVALCKIMEFQPMSRDYVELMIGTDMVKGELLRASERGHIPSMHSDHLLSLFVPIPPLNEQYRILDKVYELMTLCDSLKEKLNDTQTTQVQLANAIVEQATS